MDTYQEIFEQCRPCQLNSPYRGEDIGEIRGIALPREYMAFLRLHNGGTFSNPNDDDAIKLVLFSLEEILKGDCYKLENGIWLGSEKSWRSEYQNSDTNTVTDCHGIDCVEAQSLYEAFYDDHIVIGFYESGDDESDPYVNLLAIDREGNYRSICDGDIEELGRHEFGTHVKTAHGGYAKYSVCLFETPMGLLDANRGSDGKGYQILDRSEIEIRKKKYDYYSPYGLEENPHWDYNFWDAEHDDKKGWKGSSMRDLFAFFLSGEM